MKTIEGITAARKTAARSRMLKDSIYSSLNRCGDAGSLAAQAAMYTDILVTEDANLFRSEFGRLTHDEIKFFNAIQRAAIDAIEGSGCP